MSQEQHLHHAVAERFRTVATLIGTPASAPFEIDGQRVVPGLGLLNEATRLHTRADRVEQGQFQLTVAGTVSRGKSTLLNACLGAEIFPTGSEAVTGGICQVVYGSNNFDEVTLFEKRTSRTMPYAEFCKFISLMSDEQPPIRSPDPWPLPERLKNLHHAMLRSDSPLCEQGIRFVDTLGFNAGPVQELITQRFLHQTDAVLMVLRTEPLFDANDVNVIKAHYQETEGGIGNMFFVANDFGTMSDEDKRVLLEETAPQRLRDSFTGADGEFDQALFDRRVFLVNAKAALDAKLAGAADEALESTGILSLERAFERVMSEGEHLRIAIDAAVAQTLLPALDEAHRSIQRQRGSFDVEAAKFESAVDEAEAQLAELSRKAESLRTTFESYGRSIGEKAAAHFHMSFVTRFLTPPGHRRAKPPWYEDWDSLEFGELLSLKNVAYAAISKGKRDELAMEMRHRLEQYFRQRLNAWGEEVITYLQPDTDALIAKTEGQLKDFVLQLDEIKAAIAAEKVSDDFVDMDKQRAIKVVQILLSVAGLRPGDIIGILLGTDWRGFIAGLVSRVVTVIIAAMLASFFGGPVAWAVFIGVLLSGFILTRKAKHGFMLNGVRDKIGDQFKDLFNKQGPEFQRKIRADLEQQFTQLSVNLQGTLDREIAAVQQELDTAVEKRRGGQAAIAEETARLETIGSLLTAQFEELSRAAYGRVLTPEEQRERVDRFLFTEDEDDA